jgi:hypothetical protein
MLCLTSEEFSRLNFVKDASLNSFSSLTLLLTYYNINIYDKKKKKKYNILS